VDFGHAVRRFWWDDRGQDLVEYSLILGLVALSGAAAFLTMRDNTASLWSIANSRLAANAPVLTNP
jgi:Flp pilus assembly pilin Flp